MTAVNINDVASSNEAQTILAIGDSGTGKSIAMCSYPGPVLNISLDNRIKSPADWYKGLRNDIFFEDITNFEDLDKLIDDLEFTCPYKTIILDPVSNLTGLIMRYGFTLKGADKGKRKGLIEMTTVEDYGVEYQGISEVLSNLKIVGKKHKINIIFTAHLLNVQYTKPGGAESYLIRTILTQGKKIAAFLPSQFDEVYHFYTEIVGGKVEFKVKTINDGVVAARSSYLKMPQELSWTNSVNFYKFISQYYGAKSEPTV